MIIWFVCLIILAALTVVACSLALASDADDIADATLAKLPTQEGRRRYPNGIYTGGFDKADADMWHVCTCTARCPTPCKGECGCAACLAAYNDYLSGE